MDQGTLTLKFRSSGAQAQQRALLEGVCAVLLAQRMLRRAVVNTVFEEGHPLSSMFTIDVEGAPIDLPQQFKGTLDLQFAEWAAQRKLLNRTA